jgi:hypothetical protein
VPQSTGQIEQLRSDRQKASDMLPPHRIVSQFGELRAKEQKPLDLLVDFALGGQQRLDAAEKIAGRRVLTKLGQPRPPSIKLIGGGRQATQVLLVALRRNARLRLAQRGKQRWLGGDSAPG